MMSMVFMRNFDQNTEIRIFRRKQSNYCRWSEIHHVSFHSCEMGPLIYNLRRQLGLYEMFVMLILTEHI